MRWPENYKIKIKNKALAAIASFYKNVGKKNVNSYGEEEIQKLIRNNIKSISKISHTNLISDPILDKWRGYGRVNIGKWNFAIDIKGNKVILSMPAINKI